MSKYDTTSTFPHQIDPPVFFSDIRLEHEVALGAYKELIAEKKYDEAIAYLEEHTEVDAYCSDLFNMLINRTRAVQKYASGDYTPPAASNPVTMLSNLPSDASGVSGNTVCMSGDNISNLKIVSWADGTWEEKAAMISAHKAGDINIYDHWNIGDKCTISLSAMSATGVGENHSAQNVEIMLTDKDVYTIANSNDKCVFTWDMVDCLSKVGYMNSSNTNVGGWDQTARRTWCNNIFYNALPSGLKDMLLLVKIPTSDGGTTQNIIESTDYCFLRSAVEVFGEAIAVTVSNKWALAGEGKQIEYYKNNSIIKKLGTSGSANTYFTRSPRNLFASGFIRVGDAGVINSMSANYGLGIAVCGCI